MAFMKLNEANGGPVLVNLNKVERITKATGGNATLWYSADDRDTLIANESFDHVEAAINDIHKLS